MKDKKKSFSLLEILVSLSILVILSSLLGVKTLDLIEEHRFKSSFSSLRENLLELKVLCLTKSLDCKVIIFQKKGRYYYQFLIDPDFSKGPLFLPKRLHHLYSISLDGKKRKSLEFLVDSSGIFSIENVVEFDFNKEKRAWLDLTSPNLLSSFDKALSFKEKSHLVDFKELKVSK